MASTVAIPSAPPEAKPLSLGGLLVLAFGAADFGLESSIVLPALPAIAQEYSASLISVSWLATGFLLASVVAVPLSGRLGDLFGRRRMLLAGLTAFAVGSLICALADSIGVLIAGRIVQGAGAAIGPLALGIARDTLPRERLAPGIGILVGAAGAGSAIGFLISGVLVDEMSVQALFWLLFAVAIVLIGGVAALVPAPPPRLRARVDVAGAVLVASGLASLLLAISKGNDWGWGSGRVVVLFAGAAALLAAFLAVEGRVREPLIDVAFIARRPFLQAHVCALAVGVAFAAVVIVVPQIATLPELTGYGLGYSVTSTGLLLVPMALASIAAAWIAGRAVDVVGPRVLMALGSACAFAAYLLLIAAHDSAAPIATGAAGVGLAVGFAVTAIISVVARGAPLEKTSAAVAVHAVVRTAGIAIGTAATAAIITGAGRVGPLPAESGYTDAFVMGAIASGCALLVSALLPGRR